jgi:iron complex outermembrane recepter protein
MIRRTVLVATGLCSLASGALRAQTVCDAPNPAQAGVVSPGALAHGLGATPGNPSSIDALDRPLALQAGELTLRAALDRVASAAQVRLTYSPQLLPLDRTVCASWASGTTVRTALESMLAGTSITPMAIGTNQIVLAPARDAAREAARATVAAGFRPNPALTIYEIDGILVLGSAQIAAQADAAQRTVLTGRTLESQGYTTLAQVMGGGSGLRALGQASPVASQYGGVRGASSFGVTAPKVYVDGIELANPLLVPNLDLRMVDRIEIIHGPQGAALYGADAISGVVSVFTRAMSPNGPRPTALLRSGLGSAASAYAPGGSVNQSHALSFQAGDARRSAGVDVAYGTDGGYLPGAFTRQLETSARGRIMGSKGFVDATLRFSSERAVTPPSPLLSSLAPWIGGVGPAAPTTAVGGSSTSGGSAIASVGQYTFGATAVFTAARRWTYSATLGFDGYDLEGSFGDGSPIPSLADSALNAARGSATRGTIRVTGAGIYDVGANRTATITLAAERSALTQRTTDDPAGSPVIPSTTTAGTAVDVAIGGGPLPDTPSMLPGSVYTRTGYGFSGRADLDLGGRASLMGGLRLESTDAISGPGAVAALPQLGASAFVWRGDLSLKLRGAYGQAIRWPQLSQLPGLARGQSYGIGYVGLGAERQSGIEAGFDVTYRESVTVRLTRFDQTASGLVQRVAFLAPPPAGRMREDTPNRKILYRLENVGEIANTGWEAQATLTRGPLALSSSLSMVNSRVQRLAESYGGDLRVEDRMLEVPSRTLSLTGTWTAKSWSASMTGYRAADWINYDRLALAKDYADGAPTSSMIGESLRKYWLEYDGVTRLRASVSREIFSGWTLTMTGDNLLGYQLGDPDNVTVLPGRSVWLGLRAAF